MKDRGEAAESGGIEGGRIESGRSGDQPEAEAMPLGKLLAVTEATLAALINLGKPIDLLRFETLFNMPAAQAAALYDKAALAPLGKDTRVAIPRARHTQIAEIGRAHV